MRTFLPISIACCALSLGGCTLLVKDKVDPLVPDETPDMQFELIAFDPHIGQLTELRLINSEEETERRIVQAVAIYDPLPGPDVTVVLENVIRPNLLRVDFYSDLNENGTIDPPEPDPIEPGRLLFPDHMWRRMLEPDGTGEFMHSTDFTDIVTQDPALFSLGDFRMNITGVDPFLDQPAEIHVFDPADREVGYYFLGSITGDPLDVTIPGIIDVGTTYLVVFEPGGADEPFCIEAMGDADGLTVTGSVATLPTCQG